MRDAGPGGRLPVDVPDVIALRVVRPELRQLRAAADQLGAVVAREQPLDASREVDVECAEQGLRQESGTGPRRGRFRDSETLGDQVTPPSACSGRSAGA